MRDDGFIDSTQRENVSDEGCLAVRVSINNRACPIVSETNGTKPACQTRKRGGKSIRVMQYWKLDCCEAVLIVRGKTLAADQFEKNRCLAPGRAESSAAVIFVAKMIGRM